LNGHSFVDTSLGYHDFLSVINALITMPVPAANVTTQSQNIASKLNQMVSNREITMTHPMNPAIMLRMNIREANTLKFFITLIYTKNLHLSIGICYSLDYEKD